MIYHIAERSVWVSCIDKDEYEPREFEQDGFIHCANLTQVENAAQSYFEGQGDLVLLVIDPDLLESEVAYENLADGEELFPHIYGELQKAAVIDVVGLNWGPEGELLGMSHII
jgi:uncharacterized protein (DUF952 family)